MADVPVTLNGVLYDLYGRTTQRVVFIGDASYTGLGVGGGPMPGGPPLGIWGGRPPPYVDIGGPGPQPHPEHPIVLPPVDPGGPPVQIWPSPGHPAHPIVLPPPPPEGNKPPPPDGGWGYSSEYGWGYFPMGQSAGPKA
jgi:hypothetical protein